MESMVLSFLPVHSQLDHLYPHLLSLSRSELCFQPLSCADSTCVTGTTKAHTTLAHFEERPMTKSQKPAKPAIFKSLSECRVVSHAQKLIRPNKTRALLSYLPIEVVERILSFATLADLCRYKRIDKFVRPNFCSLAPIAESSHQFNALLSFPHMYPTIALSSPLLPKSLSKLLPELLPGTRTLSLPSFPLASLASLLPCLSRRLTSLDLSFSAVTDFLIQSLDEEVIQGVKVIKLKGCRGIEDGRTLARLLRTAEIVDLSWSGIRSLPFLPSYGSKFASTYFDNDDSSSYDSYSDDSGFFDSPPPPEAIPSTSETPSWPSLQHLSLSSCPFLPVSSPSFSSFLCSLPPNLQFLDLSHLRISASVLEKLDFTKKGRYYEANYKSASSSNLAINLRGNDLLTRSAIARLGRLWETALERSGELERSFTIEHDAVLESEGEDDVRRFVEMVAGNCRRES